MATVCCSFPSITETIGMYSLGNHEIRLYRTCKASFSKSEVRRKWWQHVQIMKCLPFHLSPVTAHRSWHAFVSWRDYVYRNVLPAYPSYVDIDSDEDHDGSSEHYLWSRSPPSCCGGLCPNHCFVFSVHRQVCFSMGQAPSLLRGPVPQPLFFFSVHSVTFLH